MRSAPKSLSRWEIVGAWLHVWTPPRDAEVPPIPRRKVALGALALAGLIALGLALVVPPLESGKRKGEAERAREEAAAAAAETARLRTDQRVHRAAIPAGADPVDFLAGAITADAKARAASHTITGPVLSTSCVATQSDLSVYPQSTVYKCFVKTSTGHPGVLPGDQFGTGYPFVATIYTRTHRVAWCKQNPRPDERTRGHKLADVRMSPVCAGRLSEVL